MIFNEITPQKETEITSIKVPNDTMIIEGYVVSKRINSIWINDQPVGFSKRIFGYLNSDYGPGTLIVSKHIDSVEQNIFNQVKINEKVRVYCDYLRESYPGKTSAYYIEVINND